MSVDLEPSENKKLACGTMDNLIKIFTVNKSKNLQIQKNIQPLCSLRGHNGSVNCCRFLNYQYLISAGSDATVGVWDLENPSRYLHLYTEHT
jgi:WD40 repeat protein